MATLKAIKAKEDARRQALDDQLDAICAKQDLIVEELHKVLARLEALEPKGKVKTK